MVSSRQILRNRLKLRQLALLPALDETGSLHKAADRLGMSQPAATRLLQDLEELMQAELFERTPKGMQATPIGRLMIRQAVAVLAGIDQIHDEALALRSGNRGHLRLGIFPAAPPALAAQAISALKQESPQIEVQLHVADNDRLLADLQDGTLALVIGRAPPVHLAGTLDFELLYTDHFSVACGASHTRIPQLVEGLADLLGFPWVLPLPGTAFRNSLDLQFLAQCGGLPRNITECGAITGIQALLATGESVAVMPRALARPLSEVGQLRILIDRLPHIAGPVGVMTRSGESRSAPQTRLIEALHNACRTLRVLADDEPASLGSKH